MISKSVPARARTRTFAIGIDYVTDHTHQRAVAAAGASFEGGVTYATAPEKAAWIHLRGVSSLEPLSTTITSKRPAALCRASPPRQSRKSDARSRVAMTTVASGTYEAAPRAALRLGSAAATISASLAMRSEAPACGA